MTTEIASPLGPLPSGWTIKQLSEITVKIGSGATPKGGTAVYLPNRENFALIRSQNVYDRAFNEDGLAFISESDAKQLQGVYLHPEDILLNITGDGITFGRSCIVPTNILPACVNQHVAIIRTKHNECVPGYLLSYLTHPQIKKYIESFNAGGSRRAITKGHIESFKIPLPPLPEQRAIAHILGSLDNKIELNLQMNETLDAMARAVFKEWFVDFGPVRAKMEGRGPDGLVPEIATLFPDRLDGDGIPMGWHRDSLLHHAQLISGGTPKTTVDAYWHGSILWASAKDVSQCGETFLFQTERTITSRGLHESSTRLIPQFSTVIVARGATTGRFCMFGREMAMNQTCYALHSLRNYNFWLNCMFGNIVNDLVQAAHGSVFDTITTKTLEGARIIIPSEPLLARFEEIVTPLFSRILSNIEESYTLSQLRDLLLPKLMSGELRLNDAERLVAETL